MLLSLEYNHKKCYLRRYLRRVTLLDIDRTIPERRVDLAIDFATLPLRRRRLSPLIILVLPFLRVGGRRVTLPRRLPLRHEPVNK